MIYKLRGEWDREDDLYMFHCGGLRCYIMRMPDFGHLCGYVVVPKGHPLFGLSAEECDSRITYHPHGGVTFSSGGGLNGLDLGDTWVFGFDCNHSGDQSPSGARQYGEYRNVPYVRAELTRFALAISEYKGRMGPYSNVDKDLFDRAMFEDMSYWDEGDWVESMEILRKELQFCIVNFVKENCNG